jgi:hypothetical protein
MSEEWFTINWLNDALSVALLQDSYANLRVNGIRLEEGKQLSCTMSLREGEVVTIEVYDDEWQGPHARREYSIQNASLFRIDKNCW